jgi:hypothetical protein
MSSLFNRQYRLRFGQVGSTGREIRKLRIAFSIERDSGSGANSGTIQIWNLAKESVSELERPGCQVFLEAGYDSKIGVVFKGNDLLLNQRRDLPDVVTEIRASDGGVQLRQQTIAIGFEPGSAVKDVVQQLINSFQDVTRSTIDIQKVDLGKFSQGFVATGPVKKILDDILIPRGYQWSIQDGEVRVIEESKTAQDTMIVVSPTSGLIGSPMRTRTEEKSGVQFTSLLSSAFRPYRKVKLESDFITGIYKIDKVTHRGDSWSGDWYSIVECLL